MNITPKARFCEDKKRAASHRDLVVSNNFLSASEAALLEMIEDMAKSTEPAVAIAGYNRIVGAKQYMEKLANLAEVPKPVARNTDYNLNHNLK